jgi:hypothetical protein
VGNAKVKIRILFLSIVVCLAFFINADTLHTSSTGQVAIANLYRKAEGSVFPPVSPFWGRIETNLRVHDSYLIQRGLDTFFTNSSGLQIDGSFSAAGNGLSLTGYAIGRVTVDGVIRFDQTERNNNSFLIDIPIELSDYSNGEHFDIVTYVRAKNLNESPHGSTTVEVNIDRTAPVPVIQGDGETIHNSYINTFAVAAEYQKYFHISSENRFYFNPAIQELTESEDLLMKFTFSEVSDGSGVGLDDDHNTDENDDDGIFSYVLPGGEYSPYIFQTDEPTNNYLPLFSQATEDVSIGLRVRDLLYNIAQAEIIFEVDSEAPDIADFLIEYESVDGQNTLRANISVTPDDGDGSGVGVIPSVVNIYFPTSDFSAWPEDGMEIPESQFDANNYIDPIGLDDLDIEGDSIKYSGSLVVEAGQITPVVIEMVDNVSNRTLIGYNLKPPGIPQLEDIEQLGEASVKYTEDGVPRLEFAMVLPDDYISHNYYSFLNININNNENVTHDLIANGTMYLDTQKGEGGISPYDQLPGMLIYHFSIPIQTEISNSQHGPIIISGEFNFRDRIGESLTWISNYPIVQNPNFTLSPDSNDFQLSVYRNDVTDSVYLNADARNLYNHSGQENIQFFSTNATLVLETASMSGGEVLDGQGDVLTLIAWNGDFPGTDAVVSQMDPATGAQVLTLEQSYSNIAIWESFTGASFETGSGAMNVGVENVLDFGLVQDTNLSENLFELKYASSNAGFLKRGIAISGDGSFPLVVERMSGISEDSGIARLSALSYDGDPIDIDGDGTVEQAEMLFIPNGDQVELNYAVLDIYRQQDSFREYFFNPDDQALQTGVFDAFPVSLGDEREAYLALYFEDKAGNSQAIIDRVILDSVAPSPFLVGSDGIVRTRAEGSDQTVNYSFNGSSEGIGDIELIFKLDELDTSNIPDLTATYSEYEITVENVIVPEGLTSSDISAASFYEDGTIRIALSGWSEFVSNSIGELLITISDFAGNATVQNLRYFLPAYIADDSTLAEELLVATSDEWNGIEERIEFEWLAQDSPYYSDLYLEEIETQIEVIGFSDVEILPHQQKSYSVSTINGSGFINTFAKGTRTFSRTALNNSPTATDIIYSPVSDFNGVVTIGPETVLEFEVRDIDGDAMVLQVFVDGVEASSHPLSSGVWAFTGQELFGSAITLSSAAEVEYRLVDSWNDGVGSAIPFYTASLQFDDEPPALVASHPIAPEGYGVSGGSYGIEIEDLIAGIDAADVYATLNADPDRELDLITTEEGGFIIDGLPSGADQSLTIHVVDRVGNAADLLISGIYVDSEPPVLLAADSSVPAYGGTVYLNSPFIPLNLHLQDSHSGIAVARLTLLIPGEDDYSYELDLKSSWGDLTDGSAKVNFPFPTGLENSGAFSASVQLLDLAGNVSLSLLLSEPISYDSRPPVVSLIGPSSPVLFQGQFVVGDGPQFLEGTVSDFSPIISDSIEIYEAAGNLLYDGISPSEDFEPFLQNGQTYRFVRTVVDAAGNSAESPSLYLLKDSSVPAANSIDLQMVDGAALFEGQSLRFTVSASDAETRISQVYLAIGSRSDLNGATSLSSLMTGHDSDGLIPLKYSGDSTIYSLIIPQHSVGDYAIRIISEDVLGNATLLDSSPVFNFSVQPSEQILVVNTESPITANPSILRASWSYRGGEQAAAFEYRVVRSESNTPVTDWIETTETSVMHVFEVPLEHGERYAFEVRGELLNGQAIPSSKSPGILIDTQSPILDSRVALDYIGLEGTLVSWKVSDADSPISEMTLKVISPVRDSNGEFLLIDESPMFITLLSEDLGSLPEVTDFRLPITRQLLEDVNLNDGDSLQVVLEVSDAAGNTEEFVLASPIVDFSAPSTQLVYDNGDFINPQKNDLKFFWATRFSDLQTPVVSLEYQLTEIGSEPVSELWNELDPWATSVSLQAPGFADGEQIVAAFRVTNAAGLSSISYSNGIVLDSTLPAMPEAFISVIGSDQPSFYLNNGLYALSMSSVDEQSGIVGFEYQKFVLDGENWHAVSPRVSVDAENVPVIIDDQQVYEDGSKFLYRVWGVNGAGDRTSLFGMTQPVTMDSRDPILRSAFLSWNGNGFLAQWDETVSPLPVATIEARITLDGQTIAEAEIDGGVGSFIFDERQIPLTLAEGRYRLRLLPSGQTGTVGASAIAFAVVDITSPQLETLSYDAYASEKITLNVSFNDNRSGIEELRYRLGSVSDPSYLTQGWVSAVANGSGYTGEIIFDSDLPGGESSINHNDRLLLSVQARDRSGNWSAIESSGTITIDQTGPQVFGVSQDPFVYVFGSQLANSRGYITDPNEVGNVEISGVDEESGISGYRYAFSSKPDTNPSLLTWSQIRQLDDYPLFYVPSTFTGLNMENQQSFPDGSEWYIYAQLINRAGVMSSPAVSAPLIVDTAAAEFTLAETGNGEKLELGTGGVQRPVFNEDGQVRVQVTAEAGEYAVVAYRVLNPQGIVLASSEFLHDLTDPVFEIPFSPSFWDNTPGVYAFQITLVDQGNRASQNTFEVRYNSGPELYLDDLETTPGANVSFTDDSYIYDVDGISEISVSVYNSGTLVYETQVGSLYEWTQEFFHSELHSPITEYEVIVSATDGLGISSESTTTVTVHNTRSGTLLTDEYWSGIHQLTGEVIVPDGLTLTIADGTAIHAIPANENSQFSGAGLKVLQNARLNHEGQAIYTRDPSASTGMWQGIQIYGDTVIETVTISGAERGLALINGISQLDNIRFLGNEIGLHAFGGTVAVSGATFEGNTFYGIKEEEDSQVIVEDSIFNDNGFAYYSSDGQLLSVDEVNSKNSTDTNGGNDE